MAQILTADVTVYDPSLPGTRVLRYATQSYVTKPGDTPANTFYDGRIQQPANVRRSFFSNGQTSGATQIGFGDLVLINSDGGLDGLLDYSFSGRSVEIRLGTILPNSGGVPTWVTVLKGVMEQAEFSWGRVVLRVRDRQQDLAKPLQGNRYGGTNSLPNGLDGVAADLQGKPKPLVYGQVFNCPLPCVNTTRLIYQANDGVLQTVDAVYDRGVTLTAGAAYASQADMEANAPAANQYRVWNNAAGTYIRLGTQPTGEVTADLTQGVNAAARTAGQIYSQILAKAGVAGGDINAGDIITLDSAAAYPLGIFLAHQSDTTAIEALDMVLGSVGAWYGCDATGVFRVGRVELPTGSSVGTIGAVDITSIDRVASRDPGVGIPAWKIKLNYKKLWSVQSDLGSAVSAARKSELAQESRRVEASDSSVLTANATSPEISFDTLIVNKSDADAEAARRLTIYKTRRDIIELRVRTDSSLASVLDLGRIVTLQVNRYGLSAGKKFLVVSVRTDMRNNMFDLVLWG